jgi:hypothetical protein
MSWELQHHSRPAASVTAEHPTPCSSQPAAASERTVCTGAADRTRAPPPAAAASPGSTPHAAGYPRPWPWVGRCYLHVKPKQPLLLPCAHSSQTTPAPYVASTVFFASCRVPVVSSSSTISCAGSSGAPSPRHAAGVGRALHCALEAGQNKMPSLCRALHTSSGGPAENEWLGALGSWRAANQRSSGLHCLQRMDLSLVERVLGSAGLDLRNQGPAGRVHAGPSLGFKLSMVMGHGTSPIRYGFKC